MISEVHWLALGAIVVVVFAAVGIGAYATRVARTTSDYYVAARAVGPLLNASAISGEYLSAASFLGIAGMVMKFGYDVLWYPVGYAAGYLILLLFVAAPLRRFGAYTIPDFAEGRLASRSLRKLSAVFVLLIGFFYMMPQMKGAGITLHSVIGAPYWVGVVVVGAAIAITVAMGGMKGITFVQAFQFWAKLFAITVPTFFILLHFAPDGRLGDWSRAEEAPAFSQQTPVEYSSGARLVVTAPTEFTAGTSGALQDGNGQEMVFKSSEVVHLDPGEYDFSEGAMVTFSGGGAVPNAPAADSWLQPFGPLSSGDGVPLLYTYSLIIATIFGTAGLPHVLVRFYTNPDGHAARKTALLVLGLTSVFFLFPPMIGALGRTYAAHLYATGRTDEVVLTLSGLPSGILGEALAAVTSAGAFAAFMSTTSGLMVSVTGALSHDIFGRILRPGASSRQRLMAFRLSALIAGTIMVALGVRAERFDINMLVGWSFAIAASCFFPLLSIGAWWRGLTARAAAAGMIAGGCLSSGSILVTMLADPAALAVLHPVARTVLAQPAIWTMPIAVVTMVAGSLLDRNRIPHNVKLMMVRLHVPESLGLRTDYGGD